MGLGAVNRLWIVDGVCKYSEQYPQDLPIHIQQYLHS